MIRSISASKYINQQGQALAEGLVLFLVLSLFLVVMVWLGRYLHLLSITQDSVHYLAFKEAQGAPFEVDKTFNLFYRKDLNYWVNHDGKRFLNRHSVSFTHRRSLALTAMAQPGGQMASVLRQEWGIADKGLAKVQAIVIPNIFSKASSRTTLLDIDSLENARPITMRFLSITTGLGIQLSDRQAHDTVAKSEQAWQQANRLSIGAGKQVFQVAKRVDQGWSRPDPVLDWLNPWIGEIPE